MDAEFDKRWQAASAPFDAVTIYLEAYVPLADLRRMLIPIVEILYAYCPEAKLFRLADWHDHDGYINHASPTTWQELQSVLASEDRLRAATMNDDYVRTTFFPEQRDFLLRIYVPDSDDIPFHAHDDPNLIPYGIFDLTSQESLASKIENAVLEAGAAAIHTMPAKVFFDKRYAG